MQYLNAIMLCKLNAGEIVVPDTNHPPRPRQLPGREAKSWSLFREEVLTLTPSILPPDTAWVNRAHRSATTHEVCHPLKDIPRRATQDFPTEQFKTDLPILTRELDQDSLRYILIPLAHQFTFSIIK